MEDLLTRLGRFKEPARGSAAPGIGSNGKVLPTLAVAKAGGEGCLTGAVVLNRGKPFEVVPGEDGAGEINIQPSPSSCFCILVGTSDWLNPTGNQKAKGSTVDKVLRN